MLKKKNLTYLVNYIFSPRLVQSFYQENDNHDLDLKTMGWEVMGE